MGHQGMLNALYTIPKETNDNKKYLESQGYFLWGQDTRIIPIPFPFFPTEFESCVSPTLQL